IGRLYRPIYSKMQRRFPPARREMGFLIVRCAPRSLATSRKSRCPDPPVRTIIFTVGDSRCKAIVTSKPALSGMSKSVITRSGEFVGIGGALPDHWAHRERWRHQLRRRVWIVENALQRVPQEM